MASLGIAATSVLFITLTVAPGAVAKPVLAASARKRQEVRSRAGPGAAVGRIEELNAEARRVRAAAVLLDIVGNLQAAQRSACRVPELRVEVAALQSRCRRTGTRSPDRSRRRRSRTEVVDAVRAVRAQVGAAHLRRRCSRRRERADRTSTVRGAIDAEIRRQRRRRCRADRVEVLRVRGPRWNPDVGPDDCKDRENGRYRRAHQQSTGASGTH